MKDDEKEFNFKQLNEIILNYSSKKRNTASINETKPNKVAKVPQKE